LSPCIFRADDQLARSGVKSKDWHSRQSGGGFEKRADRMTQTRSEDAIPHYAIDSKSILPISTVVQQALRGWAWIVDEFPLKLRSQPSRGGMEK
jgi:hypothetical protein